MTALALLDGTARALTGILLLAVVAVSLYILVAGLRDAVGTARDVIDHAPVPTSDTCWACGAPVEQEGDTACSAHDLTRKKEKNR